MSDLIVISFEDEHTAFAYARRTGQDAEGVPDRDGRRGGRHQGRQGQGQAAPGPQPYRCWGR